jgi:hypothetical protein
VSVRLRFYAAYALLVVGALGVAAHQPLLFQKLNTIVPASEFPPVAHTGEAPLDVARLIGSIPLQSTESWAVDPGLRYRRALVEGAGNCSQLSFGIAYGLERSGTDYQIVHILSPKGLAVGEGHTIVRTYYRVDGSERLGLIDPVFGGLPQVGDRELDVATVDAGPVEGFSFRPLNAAAKVPPHAVFGEDLADAVVGYVPPSEVRRYFAFVEAVYVPLGHEKAEKYLYDGLALALGFLPRVYVPRYDDLMAHFRFEAPLQRAALWTLRSALVMVPLLIGLELIRRRARAQR